MRSCGVFLAKGHVRSAILDMAICTDLVVHEFNKFEPWLAYKITVWRRRYIGD